MKYFPSPASCVRRLNLQQITLGFRLLYQRRHALLQTSLQRMAIQPAPLYELAAESKRRDLGQVVTYI